MSENIWTIGTLFYKKKEKKVLILNREEVYEKELISASLFGTITLLLR